MQFITDKATEKPLRLIDVDENGFTPLRRWREENKVSWRQAARILGVSVATYYRIEATLSVQDSTIAMRYANSVVRMTHGKVRYRDLIADFIPEYA